MKKFLFLTALLCSSTTFAVEGDSYFGGSLHSGKFEASDVPDARFQGLNIEYGRYVTDQFAIEGHYTFGVGGLGSDTIPVEGRNIDMELEQAFSVFVKGDINVGQYVNLYGLVGYTTGKLKMSAGDYVANEYDSGFSQGAGVEVMIVNDLILSAEYIKYLNDEDFEYSGFNFGVAKKF